MAISGLVVTVIDGSVGDCAAAALAHDPRLTVGERFGRRVALVADTPSVEADRDLWDQLRATPGIVHVDVTFVQLDTEAQADENGPNGPLENRDAHD